MKTNVLELMRTKILNLIGKHKKIFVAYSGGLDSHVLLHLLADICRSKPRVKLTAIHINHGVNPKAKLWVKHCQKACKNLHVKFILRNINLKQESNIHSPEEFLRKCRYDIFAKILPKNAYLLTAHQANDQAETLLLQLFRGAGPKGLAAMPQSSKFARGYLVRPLLDFEREELLQYAQKHKLKWVEDESNTNTKFDRNLIRHQLIPAIKAKWPKIISTLNRVANHCAEAKELLEMLGEKDLKEIRPDRDKNTIDIDLLKKHSLIRQKNVLRFWLHEQRLPMPSEIKLQEVIRTVINSRYDSMPVVKWFGAEVRRFRNYLYAMPPLVPFDNKVILKYRGKVLKLPGDLGVLKIKIDSKLKLDRKKITAAFRQGGEKLKISGRCGTHDLKKLMQEWNIPPWLRNRVPLLYYGSEIIAVVGYCNSSGLSILSE